MSEKNPQSQYDQYEFNENESSTEWSNTSNLDFMNAKEPEPVVQEQAKMVLFGVAGLSEQVHGFLGMNGQVGCHYGSSGQYLTDAADCS